MKILRVRRGFSTNCSGANEYFPADNVVLEPPTYTGPDGGLYVPDPPAKVVFRWFTFMPDGAPPPMVREALAAGSSDGGVGADDSSPEAAAKLASQGTTDGGVARIDEDRTLATDQGRSSGGYGLILFFVMIGVLVLFGIGRLTRGLWRSVKKDDDGSGR